MTEEIAYTAFRVSMEDEKLPKWEQLDDKTKTAYKNMLAVNVRLFTLQNDFDGIVKKTKELNEALDKKQKIE